VGRADRHCLTQSLQVFGVEFTSAPSGAKPISVTRATLSGTHLEVCDHARLTTPADFETLLATPGPWLAGFDFPFAFARRFTAQIGWPQTWSALADHLAQMDKRDYVATHTAFRARQPVGAKHLPRQLDRLTGGAAPNNIVNPPVGRMLFEGVPRLRAAGVTVPGLHRGDATRIAVEAYPAVAARALIGTTAYKDGPPADKVRRQALRSDILTRLSEPNRFGVTLGAPQTLANDPAGDDLDAAICAVQAAWAFLKGFTGPEGPAGLFDPAEGWIADPDAFDPPQDQG